jgi:lipooligosaccharide transport system permease protein
VTYNIYVRLTYEKAYDAMLTTPIQPDDVLAGEVLWALTRASIYGGCFLLILVLWGLASIPTALLMVPVIPLAGLLFASLGIAVSLRLPGIELFSFYFTLFLTPLFLFSDVFFPLDERLSGNWLWLAEALPLLHPVRIARAVFRGQPSPILLWDVAYTLVASVLLLATARSAVHRRLTS